MQETNKSEPGKATRIIIRPGTAADVRLIAEFIRSLAEFEKLEHEVTFSEDQLRRTLFGNKRHAEVMLGFMEDKPAGFAVYYFTYSTFLARPGLYLEDLFVKPQLRGKGIGTALFNRALKRAREEGCGRFEWSVLHWNSPAIEFYEKLGAQAQKEWVRYRLDEKQIQQLSA
jgi:GNAT superfamily N-acetyltransferase